ncbi:MAG: glycosyltransferase [candidate division Zixibacteria bacterium]|nr:glycosyltransferase [Candidatus Tariuqbacter arcticus]
MKISLIVSTYNRADITRAFLRNIVMNHQRELYEIVFTDDGSEEDIITAINNFKTQLTIPCRIVIQRHKGYRLARVRNNGVRHSSGDYLCFLDQDLIPSKDYFLYIKRYARPNRFLITRPIYTDSEQKAMIVEGAGDDYLSDIHKSHRERLRKLALKDLFYHIGKHLGIGDRRPKLQGGAFSLFKNKFELVNGFDENFSGWGLEDDDLGRRLYLVKVFGFNISHRAWTYHLWHQPEPTKLTRPNVDYYRARDYSKGDFKTPLGLDNSSDEKVTVVEVN